MNVIENNSILLDQTLLPENLYQFVKLKQQLTTKNQIPLKFKGIILSHLIKKRQKPLNLKKALLAWYSKNYKFSQFAVDKFITSKLSYASFFYRIKRHCRIYKNQEIKNIFSQKVDSHRDVSISVKGEEQLLPIESKSTKKMSSLQVQLNSLTTKVQKLKVRAFAKLFKNIAKSRIKHGFNILKNVDK